MITADLDAELAAALRTLVAAGKLPGIGYLASGGSWRPVQARGPASYATSFPFQIARLAGRGPADMAGMLAAELRAVPWISAAEASGGGYLTITVTSAALASVARRIVAAGPRCTRSDMLRGTSGIVCAFPDLAAAVSWQQAWQEQAGAMTGRLAAAAGATMTQRSGPEPGAPAALGQPLAHSPVREVVAYFGADAIRYWLARTRPDLSGQVAELTRARPPENDPHAAVQLAHADAASTLRWAADLQVSRVDPGDQLAAAIGSDAERELLGLLSWLPVRIASAARRRRPDDLPRYLEDVAASWTACRQARPALPFGGAAAVSDPAVTSARLLLAAAVRAVLDAGLGLTGIAARDLI